jgi:hypothetical protein
VRRLPPQQLTQQLITTAHNNSKQQQASKKAAGSWAAALASQPERKGDNGKFTLLADDCDEGSSVLLDTKI